MPTSSSEHTRCPLETLSQGLAAPGLKSSNILIRPKFSLRGWLTLAFPSASSSSSVPLPNILFWAELASPQLPRRACTTPVPNSYSHQFTGHAPANPARSIWIKKKMFIAQIKSAFLHLSAVPVVLSNMDKYWQLLKYPPKSTPPKWHLGYETSCITRFSITWQDTQDCVKLSWNKFTRHKERWFWVLSD